eukprot:2898086-Pleurochrysis_carterae.AAC.3
MSWRTSRANLFVAVSEQEANALSYLFTLTYPHPSPYIPRVKPYRYSGQDAMPRLNSASSASRH